jgi:hypothetical protein
MSNSADKNSLLFNTNGADAGLEGVFQSTNLHLNGGINSISNLLTSSSSSGVSTTPSATMSAQYQSGVFTVGSTGKLEVDFLFDGGSYQGELAVFSLTGLEPFQVGSGEWIHEAARRALSDSTLGAVVISDSTEGAKFSADLPWEINANTGRYQGAYKFQMQANDQFGLMLVPNGTVKQVFEGKIVDSFRPLFSLVAYNPNESFQMGQIADLTGNGSTFVFEDLRMDGNSDRDYNDLVFQIRGARGQAPTLDALINSEKDWRNFEVGKQLSAYISPQDKVDRPQINIDIPKAGTPNIEFPKTSQPFIGIIDTGFSKGNLDIGYDRITLGRDLVGNDADPLLNPGEGNEHGTPILGIIGATQNNGIGIDGINDDAPIWLGRAVGSGRWGESLVDFVNAVKKSGQPNGLVNLSFDLTQKNPDGTVTTRFELTPQERQAIEYARQNNVLIVAAAGNQGGTMSALGQASQEFDNIITVGSIDYNDQRANYSSFGFGLDLVAYGGTIEKPVLSTLGSGEDIKAIIKELDIQWERATKPTDTLQGQTSNPQAEQQVTSWWNPSVAGTNQSTNQQSTSASSGAEEEELPDDEMSIAAKKVIAEAFGEFPELSEAELAALTPEERRVYEEATEQIDQFLNTYLDQAIQKISLEYVDGVYKNQVDALGQLLGAFDGGTAETLIKAQEILQAAGYAADLPVEGKGAPVDLGLGTTAGTSIAAARVTGIASQVWAANPGLNSSQLKDILKRSADDLGVPGWDKDTGAGRVDLAKSLTLAQITNPERYQPVPIQFPLNWSGEGKLTAGERPVWYSVPAFTGNILNAGYVNQVGFLRVRSGPGQNFAEVGTLSPGANVAFDAVENNGSWVADPYMPGGGSSRWYRIAGTNNWMSGLYFDNSPEQAEQERQRQEAIRNAEEEARRAEAAAKLAQEEAQKAADELRRIEAEQFRIEEEQRQKREQFQTLVTQVTQQYGDPGLLLGSWISNGIVIYQFAQGQILQRLDGTLALYQSAAKAIYDSDPYKIFTGNVWSPYQNLNFVRKFPKEVNLPSWIPRLDPPTSLIRSNIVDPAGFFRSLEGLSPLTKVIPVESFLDLSIKTREFFTNGVGDKIVGGIDKIGNFINTPLVKKLGSNSPVIGDLLDLGFLAADITIGDDATKRRAYLKTGAMALAGGAGAVAGGLFGFGAGAVPVAIGATLVASSLIDLAYLAADFTIGKDNLDGAIESGFNAVSSAYKATLDAARQKAAQAQQLAQKAAETAKAAYQVAQQTVQKAKEVYQTFKQEIDKRKTEVVQQATQKMQEAAKAVVQAVARNPVVQATSAVINHVATYAKKAVQVVSNVINRAKQFVSNVIETGKQIVNNIIETGKQAYETVKTFVSEKVDQGKQFVAEQYQNASKAVNNVVNNISNGFNGVKSLFGW